MSMIELKEFAVSRGDSVNPSKYKEELFDLYSIPAYDKYKPEVQPGSAIGSAKKAVKPNDVLLSRIVPHIRRVWVVGPNRGRRQIASGEWIIYRGDTFFPNYLRYVLMTDHFHHQFMQTVSGVGGSLLRARPSEVEKIKIPLPPLPEQKRIAAILDKADAIRHKRQATIKHANDFLRATFLDLFGDPVTNTKGWPLGTIRDLITEAKYGTAKKASTTTGNYPILRMNNITYSGDMDFTDLKYIELEKKEEEKYLARKGDLLFNRTNSKELVGKTAVFESDTPMAIAGYLIRVRTNEKATPQYISSYLNSSHGKTTLMAMCKSIVGMANINAQELQDIPILIPPIELQRKYSEFVKSVQEKLERQLETARIGDSLFNSLTQRAFRGEL